MILEPPARGLGQIGQRRLDIGIVALGAEGVEPFDLFALGARIDFHDAAVNTAGQRRHLGFLVAIQADDLQIAALDGAHPLGVAGDQLPLDVAGFDGLHHAALLLNPSHFRCRAIDQRLDLGGDHGRAVENVAVFQQVGFEGQDLLHPQRPLLIPRPRQPSASFQAGSWMARARAFLDRLTPSISSTMRCTLFSGCASVRPSELTCTP
jgi:hypothetical protein